MKNEGLELVSDGFYYEAQYDSIDTTCRESDIMPGIINFHAGGWSLWRPVCFYSPYLKSNLRGLFRRYSMNENCGSKQTNFERSWICNENLMIFN